MPQPDLTSVLDTGLNVDTSLPETGVSGIDTPMMGMPTFTMPDPVGNTDNPTSFIPNGESGATGTRADIVSEARKYLGDPYSWGGTRPGAFDCSGLTQYVYSKFGINLPRISAQQGRQGKRVSLDQLQPGDLVLWDNSSRNNGADHVAIYIGNGQIIEAPRPGKNVQVSKLYDTSRAWGVNILG